MNSTYCSGEPALHRPAHTWLFISPALSPLAPGPVSGPKASTCPHPAAAVLSVRPPTPPPGAHPTSAPTRSASPPLAPSVLSAALPRGLDPVTFPDSFPGTHEHHGFYFAPPSPARIPKRLPPAVVFFPKEKEGRRVNFASLITRVRTAGSGHHGNGAEGRTLSQQAPQMQKRAHEVAGAALRLQHRRVINRQNRSRKPAVSHDPK